MTDTPLIIIDLLQETFLRAYRFWHQFTPGTDEALVELGGETPVDMNSGQS